MISLHGDVIYRKIEVQLWRTEFPTLRMSISIKGLKFQTKRRWRHRSPPSALTQKRGYSGRKIRLPFMHLIFCGGSFVLFNICGNPLRKCLYSFW